MTAGRRQGLAELVKSVAASALAFSADFGLLVLFTELAGLHYLASAALSFCVGASVSYTLSVLWIFRTRRFSSRLLEYALFVGVGVVGLGLNEVLLWLLTEPLGLFYMASKVVAAALIFFWNFGARKLILFPHRG
jgi:putative flippase GtrA